MMRRAPASIGWARSTARICSRASPVAGRRANSAACSRYGDSATTIRHDLADGSHSPIDARSWASSSSTPRVLPNVNPARLSTLSAAAV